MDYGDYLFSYSKSSNKEIRRNTQAAGLRWPEGRVKEEGQRDVTPCCILLSYIYIYIKRRDVPTCCIRPRTDRDTDD